MRSDLRGIVTPEWIAAALIGILAIAVLASSTVASPQAPAPSASASPTVRPSASSAMDPVVRNALLTALTVNERLADRGVALEAILDGKPTGTNIAGILRIVNTDVLTGRAAADRLVGTSSTATLGQDLSTLYEELLTGNAATLGVSLQETAAYVARAKVLIERFADLPALDDRINDALTGGLPGPDVSGAPSSSSPGATSSATPTATPTPKPTATPKPTKKPTKTASPTPQPSGSPPASSFDTGLVPNGTFDSGLADWRLDLAPEARAVATHDATGGPDGSGAARISIVDGTASRSGISWMTPGLRLIPGVTYRVTASLRASAPREVRIRLGGTGGQTTTARIFQVGQAWSTVSFDMTQLASEDSGVLAFDLGRGDPSVWIDNVAMVEIPG